MGARVNNNCRRARTTTARSFSKAHHIVVCTLAVLVGVGVFVWVRKSRTGKEIDTAASVSTAESNANIAPIAANGSMEDSNPVLDMGPEKDLEGNELSNVEII